MILRLAALLVVFSHPLAAKPLPLTLGQKATPIKNVMVRLIGIEALGDPEGPNAQFRASLEIKIGKKASDLIYFSAGDTRCIGTDLLTVQNLDAKGATLETKPAATKTLKVRWEEIFPLEPCGGIVAPDNRKFSLRAVSGTRELEMEILEPHGEPLGAPERTTLIGKDWNEVLLADTYLFGVREEAPGKLTARVEKPSVVVKKLEYKETVKLLKLATVELPDGRRLTYQGNLNMRLPYQPYETPTPASSLLVKSAPEKDQNAPKTLMPTSGMFAVFNDIDHTGGQISIPLDTRPDSNTFTRQKTGRLLLEVRPALPRRVMDEVEIRVRDGR